MNYLQHAKDLVAAKPKPKINGFRLYYADGSIVESSTGKHSDFVAAPEQECQIMVLFFDGESAGKVPYREIIHGQGGFIHFAGGKYTNAAEPPVGASKTLVGIMQSDEAFKALRLFALNDTERP